MTARMRILGRLVRVLFLLVVAAPSVSASDPVAEPDVEHHLRKADAYFDAGDFEAAVGEYDAAIRIGGPRERILTLRGIVRFQMGEYRGAEADFTRAIDLNPRGPDLFVFRGLSRSLLEPPDRKGTCADLEQARLLGRDIRDVAENVDEWCALETSPPPAAANRTLRLAQVGVEFTAGAGAPEMAPPDVHSDELATSVRFTAHGAVFSVLRSNGLRYSMRPVNDKLRQRDLIAATVKAGVAVTESGMTELAGQPAFFTFGTSQAGGRLAYQYSLTLSHGQRTLRVTLVSVTGDPRENAGAIALLQSIRLI